MRFFGTFLLALGLILFFVSFIIAIWTGDENFAKAAISSLFVASAGAIVKALEG